MANMKIGYHYTSWENWLKIKKEGIIPQPVSSNHKIALAEWGVYTRGLKAVWVWNKKMKGLAHIGAIFWQIATKDSLKIVQLKVKYNVDDMLKLEGRDVALTHEGVIGNLQYHHGETARLVLKPIPPQNIEQVGQYNLKSLLR